MMTRRLYRSRNGMFAGVCKGIAQYQGWSVFWVRAATLFLFVISGFWAVLIYLVLAILIQPEPVVPFKSPQDEEFYGSYVFSRSMAVQRLKETFDRLERRIRRMEDVVTSKDYQWNQDFKKH